MPDTTAKIRSKGLDSTGVTEDLARQMGSRLGSHHMAIVEFKVDSVAHNAEGKEQVALVLTQVEPATDQRLEDHLRELTRTMYYNRKVDDGQPTLPDSGGPDPKIEDVLAGGRALMVSDEDLEQLELDEADDADEDLDDDAPAYDEDFVTHDVEDVHLHDDQPTNVVQFGFGDQADTNAGQRDDPITDPHTYIDTASSLCAMCDRPAGDELHQAANA